MRATIAKIKGKTKQIEGELTGDNVLVAQGTIEQAKGDIAGAASRVARKVKRTVRRVKSRVKSGIARADRGPRVG